MPLIQPMKGINIIFVLMALFCSVAMDAQQSGIVLGAERSDIYLPKLAGKRVALFSNHTGITGDGRHTADILLENGVDLRMLLSPEHGFRGTADAGEQVADGTDGPTGLPIVSLYGKGAKSAMASAVDSVDVVIVDIQDVGLRFYTYYCTMIDLMDEAARQGKKVIVFDRPNPNGMYVDGPILDMKYASGVGRLPIPVVHGLTLGELARMANGEGWLKSGRKVDLEVVPCQGYTHATRYMLPVAPSPNLRSMLAVYLYPSMCYFEATPVSLGRGTDHPFEVYGHPDMKDRDYSFTPRSVPGAKNPPQLNKLCHGVDLSSMPESMAIEQGINLEYLIDAYRDLGIGDKFFRPLFELLIGRGDIRKMIEAGRSAAEIKATWAGDVEKFKNQRRPYLLYAE